MDDTYLDIVKKIITSDPDLNREFQEMIIEQARKDANILSGNASASEAFCEAFMDFIEKHEQLATIWNTYIKYDCHQNDPKKEKEADTLVQEEEAASEDTGVIEQNGVISEAGGGAKRIPVIRKQKRLRKSITLRRKQ